MITFAFFLVFTMMAMLVGIIDFFFFQRPFNEYVQEVLILQFGTRRWWVYTALFVGFIYSIHADYKRYKTKNGDTKELN